MNDLQNQQETVYQPELVERLNRSEIDMQIATAKKYPRSLQTFVQSVKTMATISPDVAVSCIYKLSRRNKDGRQVSIEGASVRLAEIAQASYKNSRAGYRILEVGESAVKAQGYFFDLENNVSIVTEVARRIVSSSGRRYSEDMIIMTGNAAGSIAYRNAVLKGIPNALIGPILADIKKVAVGDAKTLKQRIALMYGKFETIGVSKEKVLEKIGKKGDADITLDDLELLIGIYGAISDGECTVDDEFFAKPEIKLPEKKTGDYQPATQNAIIVEKSDPEHIVVLKNLAIKANIKTLSELNGMLFAELGIPDLQKLKIDDYPVVKTMLESFAK